MSIIERREQNAGRQPPQVNLVGAFGGFVEVINVVNDVIRNRPIGTEIFRMEITDDRPFDVGQRPVPAPPVAQVVSEQVKGRPEEGKVRCGDSLQLSLELCPRKAAIKRQDLINSRANLRFHTFYSCASML